MNGNCMQCHSTRDTLWLKVPDHQASLDDVRAGRMSCASEGCHGLAHPFFRAPRPRGEADERTAGESMARRLRACAPSAALALMTWQIFDPRVWPVMVAMSLGQVLGTASFAVFGYVVFADFRARRAEPESFGKKRRRRLAKLHARLRTEALRCAVRVRPCGAPLIRTSRGPAIAPGMHSRMAAPLHVDPARVVPGPGGSPRGCELGAVRGVSARPTRPPRPSGRCSPSPPLAMGGEEMPSANGGMLPPNHPPIGGATSPHGSLPSAASEAPALVWKMPVAWQEAPSPNAMRLATYRVPGGAEVSVSRAGGEKEANIQRWIEQFDDVGHAGTRGEDCARSSRRHGRHRRDLRRWWDGHGGPGRGAPWLGAWWVRSSRAAGPPYFFKMTGPAAGVRSSRPAFDLLIDSIAPM